MKTEMAWMKSEMEALLAVGLEKKIKDYRVYDHRYFPLLVQSSHQRQPCHQQRRQARGKGGNRLTAVAGKPPAATKQWISSSPSFITLSSWGWEKYLKLPEIVEIWYFKSKNPSFRGDIIYPSEMLGSAESNPCNGKINTTTSLLYCVMHLPKTNCTSLNETTTAIPGRYQFSGKWKDKLTLSQLQLIPSDSDAVWWFFFFLFMLGEMDFQQDVPSLAKATDSSLSSWCSYGSSESPRNIQFERNDLPHQSAGTEDGKSGHERFPSLIQEALPAWLVQTDNTTTLFLIPGSSNHLEWLIAELENLL